MQTLSTEQNCFPPLDREQYVFITTSFYRELKANILSLLLNAVAYLGVCFRTSLFNEKWRIWSSRHILAKLSNAMYCGKEAFK